MYNISNTATKSAVEAALAAQTRVFKHRISFGSLSAAGVFTAQKTIDEGIISLHISQQMNGNGSGLVMGCCCAACADAEFYNPDKTFVYEGKTLFVECGIQLEDGSFYYIPLGYYKTEKPESDDDYYTVKIKCYDAVNAMTGKWQSSLSFPSATAYDILFEAASKYGVGIVISSSIMRTKLRNRYVTAEEAAILGQYTDREVIGILAGLVGCNARINTVGKLAIGWYSGSVSIPAELQWQNGFKKTQEAVFTISSVTSGSDDNVFTAGTGSGISFVNPIITEDEITAIYGEISDYEFQPCECEWRGNPCVEVGDKAVVTDRKGKTYSVYIAAQELDLTGGLSSTVSCPAGDAEVSFDTVDERMRSALNKQRTTLQEAIIAASNAINGALGGYLKIGDSDGDGNPDYMLITENANGEAVSGSATNGYIMFNKAGIGLSVDGGKTYRTAITFNGINADCITTGKLSADLIDASKLVISSGNVEGLSDKLSTLTSNVNSANATANSAKTTANNANTTASAAQTTANSVNTVIGQWCYNHDTTFIDGGKIYTGSIAANSIDVSKLKAGTVNLNGLLINNHWDSSGTYTSLKGWEFLNSTAVIDSTRKLPKLTYKTPLVYTNMIPNSISEFDTSELTGWKVLGGTYTKNVDSSGSGWIQVVRTSSWVAIVYKLSLEKWHRYSVSAQVNTVYWSGGKGEIGYALSSGSTASSLNDIEYHYFPNIQNITNQNEEVVIDFSFDYNGETGDRYVGLIFESPQTNQATNIAWIAVSDVTNLNRGTGFYCSYSNWLKFPYKNQTIPKVSSANAYLTALGKDAGVFPQGMYQPKLLVKGKRYTLFVRLEFPEGSYQDSSPELWLSVGGKKIEFSQINIDPISPALIRAALLKFTFDYDGDTSVKNIGVEWSGFNNYSGTPNYALFHYFELFQDSVAKLGFFASQSCWLASGYQTNNLITDVADFKYLEVERSAFEVYDNQLCFRGYVQSEYGNIGCSRLSQKEISIDTGVKVYQDINDTTLMKSLYSSNLRIGIPQNEISSPVDWEGNNAIEFARCVGTTITMSRYNDNVLERETIFAPDGIQFSTSSAKTSVFYDGIAIAQNGNKVTFLANGINYNGRFISWSTILP